MYWETGSHEAPVSLAGIKGRRGFGLGIDFYQQNTAEADIGTVWPSNPLRKWLLVRNTSDTNILYLCLGEDVSTYPLFLKPWEQLLINQNIPWTGIVRFQSSGSGSFSTLEASVHA